MNEAFGHPGMPPSWASAAKDFVTTALGSARVWATVGGGILTEAHWPSTGDPQIRDLGFIVAGDGFWSEVKRDDRYSVSAPAPDVPLPHVLHRDTRDRYRLGLTFLCDPRRDTVLIRYEIEGQGLELFALLAPHLGVSGWGNTAWVEGDRLFARRGSDHLCLLADPAFEQTSAGFAGASDLWQDFNRHGRATWRYQRAEDGNVALSARLAPRTGVLALAFGKWPEAAHTLAASSLAEGWESVRRRFVADWEEWASDLDLPSPSRHLHAQARRSATVLKVHQDRTFSGASVASLSTPWGDSHESPGYTFVWPRDAVETGLAMIAAGQHEDALTMLFYLAATQQRDGSFVQNFHPDGRPHWRGIQLDQAALPIVLASKLRESGFGDHPRITTMVRRAAAFITENGPATPQDRWEDPVDAISPFTLAAEIAALVAASEYLEGGQRDNALALADSWNRRIERWTYLEGSDLAREHGVEGHYVRIGGEQVPPQHLVGLEFMALARFGLRAADDPRLTNTLKVVEAVLRVDTPSGPAYHRYLGDPYGEFGIGRAWPLLAGERGFFALQLGEDTLPYLKAMCAMAGPTGLISEQVWDGAPLPEHGLFPGKPTGSAMPLVWAHAEYVKLLLCRERFLASGNRRPVELLDVVANRYRP